MTITPQDIEAWAETKCPTDCETGLRASLSRHYYAAFHDSLKFSESLPAPGILPPKKLGTHSDFCHQLKYPAPETKGDLRSRSTLRGQKLAILHKWRCNADYELDKTVELSHIEQAKAMAKEIMNT